MGGLFELIAGNIFILIALVVGLLSLFQKDQNSDQRNEGPVFGERIPKRPTPETIQETRRNVEDKAQQKMDEISTKAASEWYEAMEDSKERLKESSTEAKDSIQNEAIGGMDAIKGGSLVDDDRSSISRISVHQNITRRRIVESIVMSEVLGKPKAKRQKSI
ncbi:hypothetical protein [Alkalibacillus aidingensis]|uniref:hypothetical protein n=1 Tax=Alkalibacillus aidingensis TaxID=2747607 RepID=UPI0016613748|nr:hypothetical protein [Alkalibacillus aidingensis]